MPQLILKRPWPEHRDYLMADNRYWRLPENAAEVFEALSWCLGRRFRLEMTGNDYLAAELAEPFDISLAAASKHVKTLERADLLERTVVGRMHICRLNPIRLGEADEWLRHYEQYWTDRFDALDRILAEQNAAAEATNPQEDDE